MINVKINGKQVSAPEGTTILEAARMANIDIPTLCYLKDVNEIGACRMCVVEIKGGKALQAACVYPIAEGMEIETNTETIRNARKVTLELILSNHDRKCLTCVRNRNCELQDLADKLNIQDIRFEGESNDYPVDDFSPSIVRDPNKCILCKRCVSVCKNVQTVSVIESSYRGFDSTITCAFDKSLGEVPCVNCGQCIVACPVGALKEKDNTAEVWKALSDPNKHVVVQYAPSIRVAIGEEFGMPIGSRVTGKLTAALKALGFDGVFDTDTAADFTIMEEGTELLKRLEEGKNLPLITSCSPGWVKFCEHNFPDFLDNLSTAKSPQAMFGALIKSYYAQQKGIDPKDIVSVSVMPCTAKKFERSREEINSSKYDDIDIAITTRECAKMIKQAGVDFINLVDEKVDTPFADASGAGVIFGATGGVMEAAIRTVADILTGEDIKEIEYTPVRGTDGVKAANVEFGGKKIRAAIAHGLGNARKLLNSIKSGEAEYDFIEIMACPGGCVTGGGQPIVDAKTQATIDVKKTRAMALYDEDESLPLRKSHLNPTVKKVYEEFLGEPCGHRSHELLHTHYVKRENYPLNK